MWYRPLTAFGLWTAQVGVLSRGDPRTDDILGLEELVTYGVKGLAAYAAHAAALGKVHAGSWLPPGCSRYCFQLSHATLDSAMMASRSYLFAVFPAPLPN